MRRPRCLLGVRASQIALESRGSRRRRTMIASARLEPCETKPMNSRPNVYPRANLPSCARRLPSLIATSLLLMGATEASGQLPGAPLLQNAWTLPGIVAAFNYGGSSEGSVFAAAAAWSPSSGHYQLSGGAGVRSVTDASSSFAYGVRLAVPIYGESGAIGFGAFAGVGGGSTDNTGFADSTASTTQIPIGATIGWRRTIGATRGVSVYGTPAFIYQFGGSESAGLFRMGVGVDVGLSSAFGLTAGADFGSTRPRGFGGPTGAQFGIGVSYAFRHR